MGIFEYPVKRMGNAKTASLSRREKKQTKRQKAELKDFKQRLCSIVTPFSWFLVFFFNQHLVF
uniref:Uncharacterized protein n=1 Tax=Rhizophora mucronata TaxID=61149 RepID=A0A2P2QP29_RHIMU